MLTFPAVGKECPVASFELHVSKLNPDCDVFFCQNPISKGVARDNTWYANKPIGLNYLSHKNLKVGFLRALLA